MNRKKVICYYVLSGEYNGLFQFGHYSEDGTSFDIDNAEILTITDTSIDIELLKSKEISMNFTLPDDEVAEEDIRISATPMFVQSPLTTGMAVVTSPTVNEDEGEDVNIIENITDGNETIVDSSTITTGDIIAYNPSVSTDKIILLSAGSQSSAGSSAGSSAARKISPCTKAASPTASRR